MGDAADDILDAAFAMDADISTAMLALRRECPTPHRCPHAATFNDDGLLECQTCHRMTDI